MSWLLLIRLLACGGGGLDLKHLKVIVVIAVIRCYIVIVASAGLAIFSSKDVISTKDFVFDNGCSFLRCPSRSTLGFGRLTFR